ncbi:hypothetical protein Vadar_027480 [Vaccinium darrowii]|uniref:Uncharacterized protein n=1 Tax=Vaccinium darrowii TaxID=229202 RepID=A0ACB7YZJ9_9ERIC|nr:hypothetical protein Vadar_027480 [Vaccinium darrowii]
MATLLLQTQLGKKKIIVDLNANDDNEVQFLYSSPSCKKTRFEIEHNPYPLPVSNSEHCHPILPPEVLDRWGSALCEFVFLASTKFYCPFKDCLALMIDNGGGGGEAVA